MRSLYDRTCRTRLSGVYVPYTTCVPGGVIVGDSGLCCMLVIRLGNSPQIH